MSLDPIDDSPAGVNLGRNVPDPANDVIIIFGGWGNTDNGEPLTANSTDGAGQVLSGVNALVDPPTHPKQVLAIQGTLSGMGGVQQGLNFIRRNFHPRGRLIIYGYSAGGTDALALCRAIWREIPMFDCSSRSFATRRASLWTPNVWDREPSDSDRANLGSVMVDLLVSVDGAAGPFSGMLDRSVPGIVRWNVNYFQTTPSPIRSHGGPNSLIDAGTTRLKNVNLTGKAVHGTIDEYTSTACVSAIDTVRRAVDNSIPDIPTMP